MGSTQEHITFLARNNRTFRPTSRLIDVKIAACTLPAGGEGIRGGVEVFTHARTCCSVIVVVSCEPRPPPFGCWPRAVHIRFYFY